MSQLYPAEYPRCTVARPVRVEGAGIHTGQPCAVEILPLDSAAGIVLERQQGGRVPASWRFADAAASDRRTVLVGEGGERFEQIEHLMAALAAEGVHDARVIMHGPEVPFLGGGSREYVDALREAGATPNGHWHAPVHIPRPIAMSDGDAVLAALPHDGLRLSVFVEFPGTVVGCMGYSMEVDADSFRTEVAPARTFALAGDIEKLRAAGLIRGGNLQNAVVFDENRYHNESLHFEDEVARHKIIDLLGDLALAGCVLRGHFWAWRAGHRSHVRFVQHLAKELNLTT